jgi:hypothetical protein
MELTR